MRGVRGAARRRDGAALDQRQPFGDASAASAPGGDAEDLAPRAPSCRPCRSVIVPVPDAVVRAGHREREALLALAQRLLGALARIDVARPSRPCACGLPSASRMHSAAHADPAVLAVGVAHAVLDLVGRRLRRPGAPASPRARCGASSGWQRQQRAAARSSGCVSGCGGRPRISRARARREAVPAARSQSQMPSSEPATASAIALLRDLERARAPRPGATSWRSTSASSSAASAASASVRSAVPIACARHGASAARGVARDDHRQRVVGHQRASRRSARRRRSGSPPRVGHGRRAAAAAQHRGRTCGIALAERRLDRRMAREQRAVAVQQRDARARVELDVAIELLEVVDAAARAPRRRRTRPPASRAGARSGTPSVPSAAAAHRVADASGPARGRRAARWNGRLGRDVRPAARQPAARTRPRAALPSASSTTQPVDLHQADRLLAQVGVQFARAPARPSAPLRYCSAQVAQHHVDRLHAARGLLGDDARLAVELAAGVARRSRRSRARCRSRQPDDRGDEQPAEPGDAAPRPGPRADGGDPCACVPHLRPLVPHFISTPTQ